VRVTEVFADGLSLVINVIRLTFREIAIQVGYANLVERVVDDVVKVIAAL